METTLQTALCYQCPISGLTIRSYYLGPVSPQNLRPSSQLPKNFLGFVMAKSRSPDGRLVYLHCSSIFSGANAHVRKVKKISQLLEKDKASIKILTKEFTLPAIAAVAKELLEEQIFESLPRAKLRYPELFQPSQTQEAERAASEAEVLRIEAEAAQDMVLTSDDEGGEECLDFGQGEQRAEPEGTVGNKAKAPNNVAISAIRLWQVLSGG